MDKQYILNEIHRTTKANGGIPLGRERFCAATGIKITDIEGKHWVRHSDAVREAGYAPKEFIQAYDQAFLFRKLIDLIRELKHFPVINELKLKAQSDPEFPNPKTFERFGKRKFERIAKVAAYCKENQEFADVLPYCQCAVLTEAEENERTGEVTEGEFGFVYLLKSGRFYKIGRSNATGRRERELAIQLPEKAKMVHEIRTDDPAGIEDYWHRRFETKRKNGEWFELTTVEVKAFKRRKFM